MASDELPSQSDELVSTTDLYSIVLSTWKIIPTQKNNSFLPPSLGGDYKRKISLTFGAAYDSTKNQTKVKSLRPSRWDLIARYSHDDGALFSTEDLPRALKESNINYIQSVFPELSKQFPKEML